MGESSQVGNRGVPATPRVGAPIEITGLLKSTLRWLAHLHQVSPAVFPFEGVTLESSGDGSSSGKLSYIDWDRLVQANFDAFYYIPENPDEDSRRIPPLFFPQLYHRNLPLIPIDKIATELVNRRGIYKDTVGSPASHAWAEYQLRPNQCVAMAVAPELFPHQHALSALKLV